MFRSTTTRASMEALDHRQLLSTVYALTEGNHGGGHGHGGHHGNGGHSDLIRFDSATPGTIAQRLHITGTQKGESLRGIDFRPATGELYLLGITRDPKGGHHNSAVPPTYTTRIYKLDTTTGVATQVGTGFTEPSLNGRWSGIDFNPTVDRLRYVNDRNQNMRIHPDTGAPIDFDAVTAGIQPDLDLAYAATDANAGSDPEVSAVAYLNNDNDATTGTTLYGIDLRKDVLATHSPPNNGTLNTVGALGVNAGVLAGFDIETVGTTNTAYAALQAGAKGHGHGGGYGASSLYTIDLTTGAATLLGKIGRKEEVVGIAVAPPSAAPASPVATAALSSLFSIRSVNAVNGLASRVL